MIQRLTFLLLAIGLALFPSIEYRLALVDGPDTEFYGLPLPWNSNSIAGSLEKELYVLPLLLNAVFFLFIGYWLWRWLSPRLSELKPLWRRLALALIWLYGVGAAVCAWIVISIVDFYPSAWYYLPIAEVLGVRIHLSL